jgi:hypothetical protein
MHLAEETGLKVVTYSSAACLSFFPPPFEHMLQQRSFELQVYESDKAYRAPSLREDNVKVVVLE